ncbi:uncharacterized protein LOC117101684 isoform X2 [Anneissia japonica]|uniref:uncharacterized protein LOC117101684 isoform X2 n=1 Tax=Anneissia japonica TaxID=1529436 RepID=UPI0014259FB5|nr:uncharacterized protein LOC117101684 isoform X2 [Anneissia japonica]
MAAKEENIRKKNYHLENLKCSSCSHTLTFPKTLSCGHTLCSRCIPDSFEDNDGVVVCKVCDEPTERQNLNCEQYITRLLEVVRKVGKAASAQCYTCEGQVAAAFSCQECEQFYCEECLHVHNRIPISNNHSSSSLDDFFSEDQFDAMKFQIRRCPTHDHPLEFYCMACDVSICKSCNDHKCHDVNDIDRSFDEKLLVFEGIKETSQEQIQELEGACECIHDVKADLQLNKESSLEEISDYGKSIERAVKDRMQSHRNEVHTKYREKMKFIAMQKNDILMMKENLCKTSHIMMELIGFKNPALVMSTGRRIMQTLSTQNTISEIDLEPVINYHMTISDAIKDLIDRIQVIPGIYLNGSVAQYCRLNPTTDVITCGHIARFHLLTNNIDGNPVMIGGADVRAIFRHHTGEPEIEANVFDKHDGSYEITALCHSAGKYSVDAYVFDRPIPDSLQFTAVQWVISEQVYSIHKGQKLQVQLQAMDDVGNIIDNTLEDISADIISPTDEIKKLDVIYDAGICKVELTTLLNAKGNWKINFYDPNEVTKVDVHVFEWNVDVVNVIKKQHQQFEINLIASSGTADIKPTKEPKMLVSLVDPEGTSKSVRAVMIDERILYRVTLECDRLGMWLINATVFDCPLQQVNINVIEWIVDADMSHLACGDHFVFKLWACDVHENVVENSNAIVKSQARSPLGEVVDLSVELMDNGVYIIEVGEIFHAKLIAVDSNQQTVSEARVNIDAFLDSVTGRHAFDVLDNADGSYTITGQCFEVGVWKLQILLNEDLYTMLDLQVVDWTVDADSTTMSVGQTFSITLSSVDENGERVTNGRGDITTYLRNPNQKYRKTDITNLDNGSYEISGMCNISGMWVLGIRVYGEPPSDFEVSIEVVKEGYVMSVDTRKLWLDKMSGDIACLVWYTDNILLVSNNTNEIIMITKIGDFVSRLCLDGNRKIGCICPCYDGRIVLLDQGKKEVLVLPRFGEDISCTFSNDMLKSPFSATVDKNYIFVVDNSKHCVMKFSFSGQLIKSIGLEKNRYGQLKRPWFAVTSTDGNLLVSDNGNNCIQMYNIDGVFVKTLVGSGRNDGSIVLPRGLSVGHNGNVFVASDHKLQLFDGDGNFISSILENPTVNPHGIAVVSRVPRQIAITQSDSSSFELYNY